MSWLCPALGSTRAKIWLTMRLTIILIIVSVLSLEAKTSAQKVNLSLKKTPLEQVLNKIGRQTGYSIVWDQKALRSTPPVSVDIHNADLKTALQSSLNGLALDYEIKGLAVYIKKRQVKRVSSAELQSAVKALEVKGQVTDSTGAALAGVSVQIKGTNSGVTTGVDGRYLLTVPDQNAVLVFSYVGYKTLEVPVEGRQQMNVTLTAVASALDQIVVIGYGTQKKADLTGSVANVSAEDLNTESNTTVGQALQGKVAGVDIVAQGGAPGGATKVMVRGIGTLNNASPLYIVDGIYMSSIDHINPSDVKSIDVLKDASSAAIYGSRAANGVIIVTTKSGSNTDGVPFVDVSANVGLNKASKYLDLLDAKGWAEVTTKARAASNLPPLDMATDLASKPDNDWQKIMFRPAIVQNYALSVKGGGKYTTYYNSVGYTNQQGVLKGSEFERYTLQSKLDFKKGIFQAGTNVLFTYDHDVPLVSEVRGGTIGHTLQAIPTLEQYDPTRVGGYGALYGDVVNLINPLGSVDDDLLSRNRENIKVFLNAYAAVELMKGLKYKINITPDFQFYQYNYYNGLYDFGLTRNDLTRVTNDQTKTTNLLIENLLTFDRSFGDHKITALAGYTYQDSRVRLLTGSGQGMPEGVHELNAATSGLFTDGTLVRNAMASILGRVFYSYKNRYLFTATLRRDGSSRFAPTNRYGNFPSLSLGWNLAEEKFIKDNLDWLDQFKIRGGYGVLGNQEIADYQYASSITTGINYPDGKGGLVQGAFPKIFSSPNIKWEQTGMTNIGIDLMALNHRLTVTSDWYYKKTTDILLSVPIPISTGGANDPIRNAGSIKNTGVELSIGWTDDINRDFSYGVNVLGTFNKNEVLEMGAASQSISGGVLFGGTYTTRTQAGYPIGGFWLIPTDGYFNSKAEVDAYQKDGNLIQPSAAPGDIRFKDVNNDGVINDGDRVYSGSPFPDFTYAFNGNIRYKDFDFALGFQGVTGNKIYNATRLQLEDVSRGTNYLASTLDYWTPDNLNAKHPRLIWTDPNRNSRAESDHYLEDGSFFRLRSLQVGYSVPVEKLGVFKKARIYFNAENLFTITSYSGYTPDVNASNVYSRGFDDFIYPINRTYMLGVNFTF